MERIPFTDDVASNFATFVCVFIDRDVHCVCMTPQCIEMTVGDKLYIFYSGEDDSIRIDVPTGNADNTIITCAEKFFCKKRVEPVVSSLVIDEDEPMEYSYPYESDY